VPNVVSFAKADGGEYLLVTGLPGVNGVDAGRERPEDVTAALAQALKTLHAQPAEGCPFDQTVAAQIERARQPGAEEGIRLCCWFAFVAAGLAAVVGTVTFLGVAILMSSARSSWQVVGVGVRRRWRSVAVAGVIFMASGLVVLLGRGAPPGVLDMFVLVGFINGVRGTFAYKRLSISGAKFVQ
jgi:hypothetical protein